MVPAMAFIARQIDVESFGLLTLVFSLVGYATVLDGGVARAVIREVARHRANKDETIKVVGTGFWLVLVLGALSASVLTWISSDLAGWLKVSGDLEQTASSVFSITGMVVVPLLLTALWVAPLEGMGQFRALNIIRGLGYLAIFAAISLAVWIKPSLTSAAYGLLVGRLLMAGMACMASYRSLGVLPLAFDRPALVRLYHFGGWLTMSNIISPAIEYVDRFVLSAMAGAGRVGYYTGPSEMLAKLSTIPHAVARALFPQLSALAAGTKPTLKDTLLPISVQGVIGVVVVCGALFFGDRIMGLWLGQIYAEISGPLLKIMSIGFLCNALNLIPYTALQAAGRSKQTALVYVVELVPYLLLIMFMVNQFGLYGAAWSWVIKTVFELVAFAWLYRSYVLMPEAV